MKSMLAVSALGLAAAFAGPSHFAVDATFEPGVKGKTASVAVTFSPTDPDVTINEEPAPRLMLNPTQSVLDDKQPPPKSAVVADPDNTKVLDLAQPVRFPVALKADAPKGLQQVKADVVYFYCSKREGWCKRGRTSVEFPVKVE